MGEGPQSGRRVTVDEAARHLGLSVDAVRKRVQRGTISHEKDPAGRVRIILDESETLQDESPDSTGQAVRQPDELVETLREQVAYLQGVIATRDRELEQRAEEIRRRDAALEREQHMAAIFADRLKELEAPAASPGERESPETVEAEQELGTERARHEMAESTMREGMDEERWRREEAERERDDLRRELFALRRRRESPQTVEEEPERAEPQAGTAGPQTATGRPWWRRVLGR